MQVYLVVCCTCKCIWYFAAYMQVYLGLPNWECVEHARIWDSVHPMQVYLANVDPKAAQQQHQATTWLPEAKNSWNLAGNQLYKTTTVDCSDLQWAHMEPEKTSNIVQNQGQLYTDTDLCAYKACHQCNVSNSMNNSMHISVPVYLPVYQCICHLPQEV